MKDVRTIYDPKTIDRWSDIRSVRRFRPNEISILMISVIGASIISYLVLANFELALLLGVTAEAVAYFLIRIARPVPAQRCPNCHSRVGSDFDILADSAEHCTKCNYWLISPYGNGVKIKKSEV